MTRINIISPAELTDQHLIAEYRESRLLAKNMHRIFKSSGASKTVIPPRFTLNKGHVLFFKDKGLYIATRYQHLMSEMLARGFAPMHPTLDVSAWLPEFMNDWQPSPADQAIVRERIALRISQRPGWYRRYGQPIDKDALICA